MRIATTLTAALLAVATLAGAAPAQADPGRGWHRGDRHDRWRGHDNRRWDRDHRDWRRDRRWANRRHWRDDRRVAARYGYGNRCWSEWRYNQRVRVCR